MFLSGAGGGPGLVPDGSPDSGGMFPLTQTPYVFKFRDSPVLTQTGWSIAANPGVTVFVYEELYTGE